MAANERQPYGFLGLLWRLTLAGALVLSLSAAGGYYAVEYLVETPTAETPDLLTLDMAAALERASGDGFSLLLEKKESSDLLEPGLVLSQRPLPGTPAKVGATVRVTVATRP